MRYHNITHDDMLNGDGLRVVLWVSGCSHGCKGCHNQITWNPFEGLLFDENAKKEIYDMLSRDYISGLTLSGGDPLFEGNRKDIFLLAREIKENFPQKTIWLYTGYLWEEIKDLEIIDYIDVLVDGKFVEALRDEKLQWKGSSNQRVIDVKSTRQMNKIVLWSE